MKVSYKKKRYYERELIIFQIKLLNLSLRMMLIQQLYGNYLNLQVMNTEFPDCRNAFFRLTYCKQAIQMPRFS